MTPEDLTPEDLRMTPEDLAAINAARQRRIERHTNEPTSPALAEHLLLAMLQQVHRRPALACLALEILCDLEGNNPSVANALRRLLGKKPHGMD